MQLTHLSLFSGIGGLDLAAERTGFRTVGQCEWADYPHAVLTKHWPDVPKWRDIRTLTGRSFYERTGLRTVDVVSGGFPCQPFSVAGKRRGADDDRYLWPEMLRVIEEIRPTWVVGENVAGIVSMALDTVLSDLEALGYACQAFVIPACAVDAPHRRDRCAIVGYTKHDGLSAAAVAGGTTAAGRDEPQGKDTPCESAGTGLRGNDAPVADIDGNGCGRAGSQSEERCNADTQHPIVPKDRYVPDTESQHAYRMEQCAEPTRLGRLADNDWWPAEPDVGRVAHGVPHRVDRLRCLGNAVVPPQFYPIFWAIAAVEWLRREARP